MSFLAPLFLIGGLAVALPIIFHLIRRTPRERIPFSSLMFLKPALPKVSKKNRLDNWFLLLLRCLIFVLLAAAFARPYFRKDVLLPQMSNPPRKVMVLLDTSASMRREGLWKQAAATAENEVRKASPRDQFSLAAFGGRLRPALTFEEWNSTAEGARKQEFLNRLAALSPGWDSTHLGASLLTAVERVEDKSDASQPAEREILVITDLQEGSRLEGLQGYQWPPGLKVSFQVLKPAHPADASLQLAESESDLRPKLRVSNSAGNKKEQFQIGAAAAQGDSFAGWQEDAYVPAGQTRVFPISSNLPYATTRRFLLKGDEEDFDNVVYSIPPRTNELQVVYLGEQEKDATSPLFYLRPVFREEKREKVSLLVISNSVPLLPRNLERAALVIAAEPLPASQIEPIKAWLAAGKTLFYAVRDPAAWASALQLAGRDPAAAGPLQPEANSNLVLGQVDFQHPLFAPFADPRYSDFSKIHFWKHLKVPAEAGTNALARFDNGDPALLELPVGKGRIFLLLAGWPPAESQLALSSKFVPFLYSMLDLAGPGERLVSSFSIGQPVPLRASGTNVAVLKPDGKQIPLSRTNLFTETDLPGIYTVQSDPPFQFAVNLDAHEMRIAPLGLDELERLGIPLKDQLQTRDAKREKEQKQRLIATELENRQKLWRWFLLAALLLVLAESGLAAYLSRVASQKSAAA